MSLKATAKEFIPSFHTVSGPAAGASAPSSATATVSAAALSLNAASPRASTNTSNPPHTPGSLSQKHTCQPREQQHHKQQHQQKPSRQEDSLKGSPREGSQHKHQSKQSRRPSSQPHPQQQQHSTSHGADSNTKGRKNSTQPQAGRSLSSKQSNEHHPSLTTEVKHARPNAELSHNKLQSTGAAATPSGSGSAGTTSSSGHASRGAAVKQHTPRSAFPTKLSSQGSSRRSVDHSGASANAGVSNAAAGGASSSASVSGTATAAASSIIPGMEPTAFICLTDVIHPVRHLVKDGVSVMEQGSDAYLDWIKRSLKEHEEITLIGMEAAIPDIISLVLRAGSQGIGYQEIRTFTTQDGLGGNKSCLQFRMRRGQGYIALEKRPPRS
ncbi:hypothetical protein KVV02_005124 [Mortierella alpina]|uniref:Uncharacterized protein n=1 Tax=Mortierella alpina TaxID=64518 RepID=A0A9P8CZL5_MORAP|nr:hypothetical protein KVV02_005124 [Mortierella alpina]